MCKGTGVGKGFICQGEDWKRVLWVWTARGQSKNSVLNMLSVMSAGYSHGHISRSSDTQIWNSDINLEASNLGFVISMDLKHRNR